MKFARSFVRFNRVFCSFFFAIGGMAGLICSDFKSFLEVVWDPIPENTFCIARNGCVYCEKMRLNSSSVFHRFFS